ncbi:efflux RND transporter permease subunit [Chryseobacterium koreense]|uniref:Copper transporter n=1 Tax=Chryseobacterium koreense CCUG 49689 TaxID=1304281 RepID=A0A0J7J0C0_9FLAO|nr:efflux RND transporter permease subunit [Chryseobacterium koreense]KMQ71499.1 copper transporter [Chryseobacterium koreense CCUG 49689]MBB5333767.1 multidrug efflux pump subunit AcrB [Chryseobacterium koreense]
MSENTHHHKESFISSWAVDNRTTVYVLTFIIVILGIYSFFSMPRESFPEVVQNNIYISSIYPGNSAEDVEKMITKKLEDKYKNVSGITKVTSNSFQDYSLITVEFDPKVKIAEAKQRIKDKTDEAKGDQEWPNLDNGSKVEPSVFDLNISEEFPILNINVKGDYPKYNLRQFARLIKDDLENIPEVKEATILGVDNNEVEIAVDIFKMNAAGVSFDQVINAIKNENITISGGNLITVGNRENVRIKGQISKPSDIESFMVKPGVRIRDIAKVSFQEKEKTTYARESGKDVVMINLKKRAGTNMISAIDQAKEKIEKAKETYLPKDVEITLTSDQSSAVEHQVNELANHILIGILLVMGVLSFSMGMKNALFVGTAIPLSMLIAFAILQNAGITLNTMVLFAMVMGLGMLVDDGIVVVDNVYANMEKGLPRRLASKFGIGEIAFPVITSTLTTVFAFLPMLLWPGIMGQFMKYFPITISVTLMASLFVALVINASMTAGSMSLENRNITSKQAKKYTMIFGILIVVFGILRLVTGIKYFLGVVTVSVLGILAIWLYKGFFHDKIEHFQFTFFPRLAEKYQKFIEKLLVGKKPRNAFFLVVGILIFSFLLYGAMMGIGRSKVLFFPENIPRQTIVYMEYPQGTDIGKTNHATKQVEGKILNVLNQYKDENTGKNYLVESMVTTVGKGAINPQVDAGSQADTPFKSKIVVTYVEFAKRRGVNTADVMEQIRKAIPNIPGFIYTVEKDANGPPVGFPISIELKGDDYDELLGESKKMIKFINEQGISGIEKLQSDINKESPEMIIDIDRETAGNLGISTAYTGISIRRALFGQNISTFKDLKEDYDIAVRMQEDQRRNLNLLFSQPIVLTGPHGVVQVPISTFAKTKEENTFNKIKRKDNTRTIMIYSGVLKGYNANEIVQKIQTSLKNYQTPQDITYRFGGEQEEQGKNMNFLLFALFLAMALVTSIIVFQFNSLSKTLIIMTTILLSFAGVFLGLSIFGMDFVILMTMMGIISLAGVVVKNGIVLMDFFVLKLDEKVHEKGVETHDDLELEEVKEIIVQSGKERLRPVLLTATTAILGLIPLAIGLNFDVASFLTELNPHFSLGGDNVAFWGPLAWTIIFGLSFATFLTLIIVPVMFYIVSKRKINARRKYVKRHEHDAEDEAAEIERLKALYPEQFHLDHPEPEA